jgi:hypothetical protein
VKEGASRSKGMAPVGGVLITPLEGGQDAGDFAHGRHRDRDGDLAEVCLSRPRSAEFLNDLLFDRYAERKGQLWASSE